ncbi:Zinc/iron permease [Boeremia exigua]|uniref:Zinc/iron permease n=1 Tax=Boeremia exigua TaxID=749465 RepID=UPI001E8D8316|nr:Zinc/iron permease [Boeremia exigua]KAH6625645.1 Zinc/iron permease [Boeremia exigua]
MWDGLFMLLTLSTIMAIASFVAGALPLTFTLSPRQLRIITLLGTGVLVGTSLIVIIPEGIETMYSAGKTHSHVSRSVLPTIPSVHKLQTGIKHPSDFGLGSRGDILDTSVLKVGAVKAPAGHVAQEGEFIDLRIRRTQELKEKAKDKQQLEDEEHHEAQKGGDDDSTEGHKEGHTRVHAPEEDENHKHVEDMQGPSPHAYIGVALILGYILMFLVDHVPEALSSSQQDYQPMHISLSNLHRGPHNSSSLSLNGLTTPGSPPMLTPTPMALPKKNGSATTIGLVVHACADGIALGASSAAPSGSLSFIVFLAIMLHKAPAAFGLTSVLLKQGLSKRSARTHLAFFSLAAPAGAFATWAIVHTLGRNTLGGDEGLTWSTGWVLCFSGGTFLYVAMHSMIEATSPQEEPIVHGYLDAPLGKATMSKTDILIVVFGMLLPLVTQIGHANAHAH